MDGGVKTPSGLVACPAVRRYEKQDRSRSIDQFEDGKCNKRTMWMAKAFKFDVSHEKKKDLVCEVEVGNDVDSHRINRAVREGLEGVNNEC